MTSPSQLSSLQEDLTQLLNTPFWWRLPLGKLILRTLLVIDPTIPQRFQYHKKVNYWWVQIHSSRFGEVVLCLWLPNSWSDRHDHYSSKNLTIVLLGKLVATLYHVSGSKFYIYNKTEVGEMEITTTPAWQIHSLANPFDELCVSLNFYWVRRPSLFLKVED
jgi:hypothetical protein